MKIIQTMSVVCGNKACNAKCPFCISKQTGNQPKTCPFPNYRNFDIAVDYARQCGVDSVLLTGVGEPTLFPDYVEGILTRLDIRSRNLDMKIFPFRELQTNGIRMAKGELDDELEYWHRLGLTTIALSVCHYNHNFNYSIYLPDGGYFDLAKLIEKLRDIGYLVRLCVMGMKGGIDSVDKLKRLIEYAKLFKTSPDDIGIQLTYRRITKPEHTCDDEITDWVNEHYIDDMDWDRIHAWVERKGTLLMNLMHDAKIWDIDGQNLCMSTCLTESPDPDKIRQVIFGNDGHLRYSWQHRGAILL